MLPLSPFREGFVVYRVAVAVLACVFLWGLGQSGYVGSLSPNEPGWGLGFFALMAILAEFQPMKLPRYGKTSLAAPATYSVMIAYGPLATVLMVLVAGLSRFARESRHHRISFDFVAYSLAQGVLSYGSGACFYGEYGQGQSWPIAFVSFVGAVLTTFLVHDLLVALHQWLDQGQVGLWGARFNWERLRLDLTAIAPLGALMAVALLLRPVSLWLLVPPLVVTYLSIKNYTDTLAEAREVIESLVEAVEKREPKMVGHAARVAALAADIARELGLRESFVSRVKTAGRLHDLGKISIDERILAKSEALTVEELESVRRHPEIGAQVAARLSLGKEESEFIRYHHEWFDGGGYPYGLRGNAIPLGARILAVAEAYDTMVSGTVYSRSRSAPQALGALRAQSGSQFDPRVVEALTTALRKRLDLSLECA